MYGRVVAARSREVTAALSSVPHRPDFSLTLSSLRLARLAPGAVTATSHGTSVLATATPSSSSLVVDFRSRAAAIGAIPNTFPRRELAPAPYETLTSRLIDRSLRPALDAGPPLALTARVLSADRPSAVSIDALAVNAASAAAAAALVDTPHPFTPVGAARLALVDGCLQSFPSMADAVRAELCLFVAARDGKVLSLLIDAASGPVPEATVLDTLHEAIGVAGELARVQGDLLTKIQEQRAVDGRSDHPRVMPVPATAGSASDDVLLEPEEAAAVAAFAQEEYERAFVECRMYPGKSYRADVISRTQQKIIDAFPKLPMQAVLDITSGVARLAHRSVLTRDRVRIDGRQFSEVRPVRCETAVLKGAVHGSALFERGDTQVLACATVGLETSAQRTADHVDTADGFTDYKPFFLHYSFPGYATGEEEKVGAGGGSRREVGHGALAEAALRPLIGGDATERLPYVTRVSAEVTASDGSSSMATVCAGSLALLDAGVAIREPVAGVAMGLVAGATDSDADSEDDCVVLADILGAEDYFGVMDCKLSGTADGLTAAQLDTKISSGLSRTVVARVLDEGRIARTDILKTMQESVPPRREGLPQNAPRSVFVDIKKEVAVKVFLRDRAAVLREIEKTSQCRIQLDQEGLSWGMRINAPSAAAAEVATRLIKEAVADIPVGAKIRARVVETRSAFAVLELENSPVTGVLHASKMNLGSRSFPPIESDENVPGTQSPTSSQVSLARRTPDQMRYQDVRRLLQKDQWLDVVVVESDQARGVLRFGLPSPTDICAATDAFLEQFGGRTMARKSNSTVVKPSAGA